ncbi:MAG TPA: DUF2911 domain-containing protein [Candidatus Angelobacter sp.]|jgi:hypothetical protein|nr:DUF2911 domain-containing protein [Candidatus Angelobacter sp.]
MRKHLSPALLAIAFVVATAPAAFPQSALLNLPRASQHATVVQRVGITDITVNYHRPLINGRKVWGGLVPYGQVWRAGANENTTIEFTDPVTIEGKPLAKGIYGLHMIPNENEWIVIFSRASTAWGSFSYDQKEDALRVTVKPQTGDMHEAVTYDFTDIKPNSTTVTMFWEKVAVPFKVEVKTDDVVADSLHHQMRGIAQYTWEAWDEAASYFLTSKTNLEEALRDSDRSIQNEERFENLMTKSQILEALNRSKDAAPVKEKAVSLANAIQLHGYGRQLQQQGKQQEAFNLYRVNIKRFPDHWVSHNEAARIACSEGNFDKAVKEMKLASAVAPDQFKGALDGLAKRLEGKEDINK